MLSAVLGSLNKCGIKATSYHLDNGRLILTNGTERVGSIEPAEGGGIQLTVKLPGDTIQEIKKAHASNCVHLNA